MQPFTFFLAALSAGSVFASPFMNPVSRQTGVNVVDRVLNALSTVKPVIDAEVVSINHLVANTVTREIIPEIQTSLTNIANELATLRADVEPLVTGVIQPLVESEVTVISNLLNDTTTLAQEVGSVVRGILDNVPTELVRALRQELAVVLNELAPAVNPIITLSQAVVTPPLSGSVVALLRQQISALKNLIPSILGPLLAALLQLL
ncbi:hypothetical protein F5X99DRAFT_408342 [Biscogniauxia marginata]|nr:hypothetical protein F5X99DRAFT_408342 [Biscogniauxia marginata]